MAEPGNLRAEHLLPEKWIWPKARQSPTLAAESAASHKVAQAAEGGYSKD